MYGNVGSPKVIVHRFKEKLVVWFLESIFQVQKSDPFGRDGQFDQVWSFLVVEMVDNFSLPHCRPLGRSNRRSSSAGGSPDAPPEWAFARLHPPVDFFLLLIPFFLLRSSQESSISAQIFHELTGLKGDY